MGSQIYVYAYIIKYNITDAIVPLGRIQQNVFYTKKANDKQINHIQTNFPLLNITHSRYIYCLYCFLATQLTMTRYNPSTKMTQIIMLFYVFFLCLETGDSGLNDNDLKASIATLQSIAEQLNCEINQLREKEIDTDRKTAEFLIRHQLVDEDFSEVRCIYIYTFYSLFSVHSCIYVFAFNKYSVTSPYVILRHL